jgi:hypothetical protein
MMRSTRVGEMKESRSDAKKAKQLEMARKAEEAFRKRMESGNVKDINKLRQKIADQYGVWPDGMMN